MENGTLFGQVEAANSILGRFVKREGLS